MPPELLGPLGLTLAAIAAAVVLWREHLRADADDRAQRDRFATLLDLSLQNNRDAIAAWEKGIAANAARKRQTDP